MPTAPENVEWTRFDRHMMAIALRLAEGALGTVAPNPAVGAVIADPATGELIARGWTQPGGRPHAETIALGRAGARARGATVYVSLEPCAHHGRTPPCTDAIAASGAARVVAAIEDPNPLVAGEGFAQLRQAGLTVQTGLGKEEAAWIARGHILRMREKRPFIQLKIATDTEGRVPRGTGGAPAWVTGLEARALGHLYRARADALLVGRQTVLDDDPLLTCRLPGLEEHSPVRVVLARQPEALMGTALVRSLPAGPPVWVFCGEDAPAESRILLENAGARTFTLPKAGGGLDLHAGCAILAGNGITRLLVEGGLAVWRAFWHSDLWDEILLFQAGTLEAPLREERAQTAAMSVLGASAKFRLAGCRQLPGDTLCFFRHPAAPPPCGSSTAS